MMIVMGIFSILSLLNVFTLTFEGLVGGVLNGAVYGYFFIVLYSIVGKFREEKESGNHHETEYHLTSSDK